MPRIDATFKGFPGHLPPLELTEIGAQRWSLLKGHLPFPLAVLKQSALQHNLAWMQNFCNQRGLDIAPHGKTTMSPELYRLQIDAGAWGISFATVFQAGLGIRHGVERIIIANQFNFSKAELLLCEVGQLQHEHCVVVDIRWELPKILPRLIQIETIQQRRALLSAGKAFAGSEIDLEGNLRQRRYRFDRVTDWLKTTFANQTVDAEVN